MELLIPHASAAGPACRAALDACWPGLPNLQRVLANWVEVAHDDGVTPAAEHQKAFSRSTPAERAMARAVGLPDADGRIPWAAWERAAAGMPTALDHGPLQGQELAWAEVTPCHWHVGLDHIVMDNPAHLGLSEADSQALLEAVRPLFEGEGIALAYARPGRWWAAGEVFDGLQTASVARVAGRNVDAWMPEGAHQPTGARLLRRLQNEVQMLLYQHPVNDARASRGEVTVNSVWFSQAGRLPAGCIGAALPTVPHPHEERMQAAVLADDWAAFADAWREVDATWLARPDLQSLTVCGEAGSVTLAPPHPDSQAVPWWQTLVRRFKRQPAAQQGIERLMALSELGDDRERQSGELSASRHAG